MSRRLVIANRGEIARRILRAAHQRGWTVAVISVPEDRDALVRREADAVLEVDRFLNGPAMVAAARTWGAEFIHPGYGFLSESPAFAEAVEASGLGFVGPTAAAMRILGGKESAKALALRCGVPVLPSVLSSELQGSSLRDTLAARGIAAPFLVKASAGGGGRGMRVVAQAQDLEAALKQASEEALAAFGDGTVFLERYLAQPRHIEAQVFGDGRGGGAYLGERECSLQRRHQKVLEEAPGATVTPELRQALGAAAMALVRETAYRGAGTVEFLLDDQGAFYFLEMNTRLQVEHPVTEAVLGVDLVHAQLDLAEGRWPEALGDPAQWTVPSPQGVALEARVLAEDPRQGFMPTPGPLTVYQEPEGPGIRVDSGVAEGGRVNAAFDSMIAKVIVHAPTRSEAFDRLAWALRHFVVLGCTTNLPFLVALAEQKDLREGRESTAWIGAHLEALQQPALPPLLEAVLAAEGFPEALSLNLRGAGSPQSAGAACFAWQQHPALTVFGRAPEVPFRVEAGASPGRVSVQTQGQTFSITVVRQGVDALQVHACGEIRAYADPLAQRVRHDAAREAGDVRAPMAGKVVEVRVQLGDVVEEGQVLFVLESMKMRLDVAAPAQGRVASLRVDAGQSLEGPEILAVLEPLDAVSPDPAASTPPAAG